MPANVANAAPDSSGHQRLTAFVVTGIFAYVFIMLILPNILGSLSGLHDSLTGAIRLYSASQ